MGIEIERKFIVDEYHFVHQYKNSIYYSERNIKQGYFKNRGVRVRITSCGLYEEDEKAFLTIKSKRDGISRYEFEYEIPTEDAYKMMELFCDLKIEKIRYKFKEEGKIWEVDVFKGENEGLILAEIELELEDEEFVIPYFVGKEVTEDERYYNSYLAKNPYKNWSK